MTGSQLLTYCPTVNERHSNAGTQCLIGYGNSSVGLHHKLMHGDSTGRLGEVLVHLRQCEGSLVRENSGVDGWLWRVGYCRAGVP